MFLHHRRIMLYEGPNMPLFTKNTCKKIGSVLSDTLGNLQMDGLMMNKVGRNNREERVDAGAKKKKNNKTEKKTWKSMKKKLELKKLEKKTRI